jgi:hypothetical protein
VHAKEMLINVHVQYWPLMRQNVHDKERYLIGDIRLLNVVSVGC